MLNTIRLAKSFVFKDERLISEDTEEYYSHVSGYLYSSTDIEPEILSLDDGTMAPVDRNLKDNHPLTYKELCKQEETYITLLDEYPTMAIYIKGCLYPSSMAIAREYDNNTIIAYNSSLIEPQEEDSIIAACNEYFKTVIDKYDHNGFMHSKIDPHYRTMVEAVACLYLPIVIAYTRLNNRGTIRMHSSMIDNHLTNKLGTSYSSLQYLTVRQKLYLYQNIDKIIGGLTNKDLIKEFIDIFIPNVPVYAITYSNDAILLSSLEGKVTKPISNAELESTMATNLVDWVDDTKFRTNSIDGITGLYYIESTVFPLDRISKDVSYNLWGNLTMSNKLVNDINITYPFADKNSISYSMDAKTAFIYVKALESLLNKVDTFQTTLAVGHKFEVLSPSMLETLNLEELSSCIGKEGFLEELNKVKRNFIKIIAKRESLDGVERPRFDSELTNYLAYSVYNPPSESIPEWLESQGLPLPAEHDIKRLLGIIITKSVGSNSLDGTLTPEEQELKNIVKLFNTYSSYTIDMLLSKPTSSYTIPIIGMSDSTSN